MQDHMKSVAGYHTCSLVWLKQKYMDKYKEQLKITTAECRNIITLKEKLKI